MARVPMVILVLFVLVAAACAQPPADEPADYQAWAKRLAEIPIEGGVFAAARDLQKLSRDDAYAILRNNWASIADPDDRFELASRQLSTGADEDRILDFIDLMMTDPWPEVSQNAADILQEIAFRRIEPGDDYLNWRRRTIGRPFGEVVNEGARELIARIESASSPGDATRLLTDPWVVPSELAIGHLPVADIDRITRERLRAAIEPDATDAHVELAEILLDWWVSLPENALTPAARRSLLEPALAPTVRFDLRLEAATAAAKYKYPWAFDPTLALLREATAKPDVLLSNIGQAIAEYGDPRAIPDLIAAIDAHNGYETVYGLGYFALGDLTGVDYQPWHTGPWWRAWWALNRKSFPKSVARLDVPTWPKSPGYAPSIYDGLEPLGVEATPTYETFLPVLERAYSAYAAGGDSTLLTNIAQVIGEAGFVEAIPVLISMIEADNTYATVYGLGYFGLGPLTDVDYDESHTGPWWRAWWNTNRVQWADRFEGVEIAARSRTRAYSPSPWDTGPFVGIDTPTATELLWLLARHVERKSSITGVARSLADLGDTSVVPDLIEIIAADNTSETIYGVGYYALEKLAGVEYDESHDGPWWVRWWNEHRVDFPESVRGRVIGDPTRHEILIDGDPMKRYVLIGPRPRTLPPKNGFKLLVVLPGGDGSPVFGPFVESMLGTIPEGYMIAQAISPRWREGDRTIWPTRRLPDEVMAFGAEEFIEAIVADVIARRPIDSSRIFAMGWSSGGTPVYTATLNEGSPISGAFVAMSVFKPEILPPLKGAAGKAFYLLHSPEDRIAIRFAELARDELAAAGAATTLVEYEGGHTWPPDTHPRIRAAIEWLEANVGP